MRARLREQKERDARIAAENAQKDMALKKERINSAGNSRDFQLQRKTTKTGQIFEIGGQNSIDSIGLQSYNGDMFREKLNMMSDAELEEFRL